MTCDEQQAQRERLRQIAHAKFDIAHKRIVVRNLVEDVVARNGLKSSFDGRTPS